MKVHDSKSCIITRKKICDEQLFNLSIFGNNYDNQFARKHNL